MICCGTRGIVDIPGGGEGGGGKAPGISTVSGRKRVGGTGGGGGGGRGGIDVEESNHSSVKETKTSLLNLEHTNLNTTYTGMYHHLNPLIRSATLYKKTMQHLLMPTQMYQIILLCGYSNYARKLAWVHSFGMISQIMVHQRNCQILFPEWIQRFL